MEGSNFVWPYYRPGAMPPFNLFPFLLFPFPFQPFYKITIPVPTPTLRKTSIGTRLTNE